ncbi:UDP-N-acetylmuramoylalanyl-D-glutamyl-2, 6-diaminopimelate--D-alanyl-D-alanine ligase [Rhodoferax koreense]|uniref:UDP-N-acetylmuramoyl-tripeptide--D-alanyl-D-alanine ligase n=1 Tax=Rhodoferax koreensis TaxID=1842727 RepID=A0A1P8K4I7_9BURK|nr:UDP-N-acetylmuramoyl-tripeptide--D-alanyl-D-alanine ligase [Rhodoferax koreense]APW40925.1 UDP-N-acetylmuramoylalanyl-D-glutamyl-2, 6-diaminopimelate--D-alanyl-D-alanine ligase [Rhodoferax koreense]
MMTLAQALAWIPGGRLHGDGAVAIQRVHTDTRSLQPGDLFVALRGDNFDANTMLAQAKASGAVAALCHAGASGGIQATGLPCIEVDDTLAALGALATGWRSQFRLPLIAVTGSNGKTTVTQMIASILRAAEPEASLATQGNYNNEIGVPLTLLRLSAAHRLAVVELGMNHPGEIARIAAMARPTVALVNNAQREHMEFMATVEAVARENGVVLQAMAEDGVAVFPADDDYAHIWRELAGPRVTSTFAMVGPADITCDEPVWAEGAWQVRARTPAGDVAYGLHIAGRHNVKNSLAAIGCALAAGVSLDAIGRGLAAFEPVKGRSRALALTIEDRALTLVDDSYNANPDSVIAAIEVLAGLPGPRLLVLGDMGEVGDQGPQFHAEVGARAAQAGIEHVLTLGELTAHTVQAFGQASPGLCRHFGADVDALNAAIAALLPGVASVLVKGSKFMKMPRVVDFIVASAKSPSQQVSKEPNHAA